eukprot:GILK01001483.1.p1 GENE.GILK01001483.1~~GILK01001483.1.p1  ORF type:complete len:171 (-),score=11.09 GILK01001483.1:69-581(-)
MSSSSPSAVRSFVLQNVKQHWATLLVLLIVQAVVGGNVTEIARLSSISRETIRWVHIVSGKYFIILFGLVLLCSKLYLVFNNVKRPVIRNSFINMHIKYHFMSFAVLLAVQYFTGTSSKAISELTGIPRATVWQAHGIASLLLIVNSVLLALEKMYLASGKNVYVVAKKE